MEVLFCSLGHEPVPGIYLGNLISERDVRRRKGKYPVIDFEDLFLLPFLGKTVGCGEIELYCVGGKPFPLV